MGWGGSKKCKPIPAPHRDVGLKSQPIPPPHHLCGAGKTRTGRSGEGRVKRGRAKLPSLGTTLHLLVSFFFFFLVSFLYFLKSLYSFIG